MKENYNENLKTKLRSRELVFGAWISFDHPSIAEVFSLAGFDFIGIDMEHAPISLSSAQRIIASAQANNVACLPRPVSHNNDVIKPLLDSGSDGLIAPMVNSPDDVKAILNHLKYPPNGKRTYGLNRAQGYGFSFDEYVRKWNKDSIFIPQIESKGAVDKIDLILKDDEVDGVMIGPYDLSGSYGVPGETDHPLVTKACQKVIASCKKFGKSCGTQVVQTDRESIDLLIETGYTFIILSSDLFVMWKWSEGMKSLMSNYK